MILFPNASKLHQIINGFYESRPYAQSKTLFLLGVIYLDILTCNLII